MKSARLAAIPFLLILLGLLLCVGAFAENGGFAVGSTAVYYVDNTSGVDTNAGTSAAAPLKTLGKAYSKMTAGGKIVICGEVKITSAFVPRNAGGTVVYTSVHGGHDYRSDGAKLVIGANMAFSNDTYFEKINLKITAKDLVFSGRFNSLGFGTGVAVTDGSGASAFTYPAIVGGYNNPSTVSAGSTSKDYTVRVRSGTWRAVMGGNRRSSASNAVGCISGDVSVVISGGTFTGAVYGSGMNVHSGRVYLSVGGEAVCRGKVIPYRSLGTMPETSNRTSVKYDGSMLVRITGGTLQQGLQLSELSVSAQVGKGVPLIYGPSTVVITGGTFGGNVKGGGTLGATLLKYSTSVLDESDISGFPTTRTATLSFSSESTEYSRFDTQIGDKADPYVVEKDGVYYYCFASSLNGVPAIKVAASGNIPFGDLTMQTRTVFTADDTSIANAKKDYWAPELHYIKATDFGSDYAGWYIYFCADNGTNANHRMYVLRAIERENPLSDYEMVGKIATTNDRWAIDGTVMRITSGSYKGMYLIWSGWPGTVDGQQNLYIQKMSSPSTVTGSRVLISSPEYSWETHGTPTVNEGPQVLQNGGVTHVVYSASGSWTEYYCYGILTLKTGANPLVASNWAKNSISVFKSGNGMYGPGHGSFVKDARGEWWMIYHANNTINVPTDSTWWAERKTYAKKFSFTAKTLFGASYSFPSFGTPASHGGEQFVYTETAHYHASGDHQYSPLTLETDGTYTKLTKHCYICGVDTVVSQVAAPTVSAAVDSTGGIRLTITPRVSGASGYKIYRSKDSGAYSCIKTTSSTSYTDTAVSIGSAYTYKVYAYKNNAYCSGDGGTMTSSPSAATAAVTAIPASIPITNLYYDGTRVYFRWTASETAAKYKLFRKTGNGSWETLAFTTDTSYFDTTAAAGVTYTYAVQEWTLVNGSYQYSQIGPVVQTITTTQLPAPTLTVENDAAGLKLTASAVSGAYGYKFYRSTDGVNFSPLKATRETSYVDTGLTIGTTYSYKVRAYTQSGVVFVYGVHSAAQSRPAPAPAVSIKSISYQNGAVHFTWDAAEVVTKYKLWRKLPNTTSWTVLGYTTDTSFADSTAAAGTTYVYAVQNCTLVDGTYYYSVIAPVGKTFTVPS